MSEPKGAHPPASAAKGEGVPADQRERLVRALASGEMRFYQLPTELPAEEAAAIRREALEEVSGAHLEHLGRYSLDAHRASTRHCENFIGVVQVPVGVAGPLTVRGEHIDGDVFVPLATTEGALVASINRGCAAIRAAGGARTWVEDVGMTRAPVFETAGIDDTRRFLAWVERHEAEIRAIAQGTSRYLRLIEIRPYAFGTTVFLRFRFQSGDAMGMNMATIACDRVVSDYIVPKAGVRCIALSGNYCVDKKPAAINFQEGRGKRLHAEVVLPAAVLSKFLKTDARALVEVQYRKNLLGSIAAGAQGYNAHSANVVAAFFLATGQDIAHVVGGSMAITNIELRGEDAVYASVYLPDLPVGAVGGGTALETQSESLSILGIKPDPARPGAAATRLGEILAAAVLAGELSLMAAFTSRDLARAHERLGRGKADSGVRPEPAAAIPAPAAPAVARRPRSVPGLPAVVSAPGKLILAGEHAVVYGRPALVAALDLRLTARISPRRTGEGCELALPAVGVHRELAWPEIVAYAEAARQRWEEHVAAPSTESFRRLRGEDPAHVVLAALGEASRLAGGATPRPFTLTVSSQLPLGSGFGSSAATASAVAQALLAFLGQPAEDDDLLPLSIEIERRQHGEPSGVDSAAVVRGGLIWARRDVDGLVHADSIAASSSLLERLRVFDTGTPAEPTGQVVAAVRSLWQADRLRVEEVFDRIERATWGLRQELARREENRPRVLALIRQCQACLTELGITPEPVRQLIARIEAQGGAAKVSGAGSLDGPGAGSLIVYHPEPSELSGWDLLAGLAGLSPRLGAPGLSLEVGADEAEPAR